MEATRFLTLDISAFCHPSFFVQERTFMAAIGDEDSITGLLLAGIGHIDSHQKKNFLVVDASKIQTLSFPPATRAVANAPARNPQKKKRQTHTRYHASVHRNPIVDCRGGFPRVHQAQGYRYYSHQPTCKRNNDRFTENLSLLSDPPY